MIERNSQHRSCSGLYVALTIVAASMISIAGCFSPVHAIKGPKPTASCEVDLKCKSRNNLPSISMELPVLEAEGHRGSPGLNGVQGVTGLPGIPGMMGVPGIVGSPGLNGEVGEIGSAGPRGPMGDKGDTGKRGQKGKPGAVGLPGYVGLPGEKGDDGFNGFEGLRGPHGNLGSKGEVGEPGLHGLSGNFGSDGPEGVPGKDEFKDCRVAFHILLEFEGEKLIVLTNEGDAFNSTSGLFTAPYNGVYAFHVNVNPLTVTASGSSAEFQLNGKILGKTSVSIKNEPVSSSNTYIVEMEKHDQAAINLHVAQHSLVYASFAAHCHWRNE